MIFISKSRRQKLIGFQLYRGFDAYTALEFVCVLRIATDIGKMTAVASLYQTGESV